MPRRHVVLISLLILVIAVLLAAIWVLLAERGEAPEVVLPRGPTEEEAPLEEPPELVLEPASFAELPGWEEDDLPEAMPALLASCRVFTGRPADAPVGPDGVAGTAGDWRSVCDEAARLRGAAPATVRDFFESSFRPWAVTDRGDPGGLFTGYYEPSLRGSRRRHGAYQTPLHARPSDLVEVDLGEFRDDLAGRRIAGRVRGGQLQPYEDREAIEEGALSGRGLEIVWVDDPVDAFFLQIQGSGRIEMEDGSVLRVGYAGQNGHPYTAIGRELVERGAMPLEEVSMQSIRRWLEEHPDEAGEVMGVNASYVFFRKLTGPGPVGSLGVALTPERSLAVDPRFLPMGAPLWLAAMMPDVSAMEAMPGTQEAEAGSEPVPEAGAPEVPEKLLRRLVVAQDTGGAIRGVVRGDVFWGPGDEAAEIAGLMKHAGRLWLLLPRGVEVGEAARGGEDGKDEGGAVR